MIKKVLLRLPNDLHEQIKLLAKQFNISINKIWLLVRITKYSSNINILISTIITYILIKRF